MEHAAGSSDAETIVDVLCSVLSFEEWEFLERARPTIDMDRAWAAIGRQHASLVVDWCRRFAWPLALLCWALQACGWNSLRKVRETLALSIPRKAWRRSKAGEEPRNDREKHNNGRTGWRKLALAKMKEILDKNSTLTCQLLRGRKGGNHKRKREETDDVHEEPAGED